MDGWMDGGSLSSPLHRRTHRWRDAHKVDGCADVIHHMLKQIAPIGVCVARLKPGSARRYLGSARAS